MSQMKRSKLAVTEAAARLRAGHSLEAVAADAEITVHTLMDRLGKAGFTSTGGNRSSAERGELRSYLSSTVRRWYEPWMEDAACARVDPALWFPDKGDGRSYRVARDICLTKCPVLEQCATYALANGERFGIWAGMGERDRQRARKREAA